MEAKVDIKLAITIAAIIAALGGFYYTTQLRLDRLESEVSQSSPNKEIVALKKQVNRLSKRVKKLEEK